MFCRSQRKEVTSVTLHRTLVLLLGITLLPTGCAGSGGSNADQDVASANVLERPVVQRNVRRNIDELSVDEMTAYQHALRLLMDRSQKNVYDINGFLWQTWVHNCANLILPANPNRPLAEQVWPKTLRCNLTGEGGIARWLSAYKGQKSSVKRLMKPAEEATARRGHPGQCQHHSDLFFQWHRAQFYYFEHLLRQTDPRGNIRDSTGVSVSTASVAVPYWDFTTPPSGNRYPRAFEEAGSILYVPGRNQEKVTEKNMPRYTLPDVIAYYIGSNWPQFGGRAIGNPVLPEGIVGEGKFESFVHDNMHSIYVGGLMNSPSTAALDPIFYSFHAFVDLIYEQWLRQHGYGAITSSRTVLRSEQPPQVANPPDWPGYAPDIDPDARQDMGRGNVYFDTARLGYTYDERIGELEELQEAVRQRLHNVVFSVSPESPLTVLLHGLSDEDKPVTVIHQKVELSADAATGERFVAAVRRTPGDTDYSYRQSIYVHPEDVSDALHGDLEQGGHSTLAGKYLASDDAYWQLGEHLQHAYRNAHAMALNSDLTDVIRTLVDHGHGEGRWVITAAIYSEDDNARAAHFDGPELIAYE